MFPCHPGWSPSNHPKSSTSSLSGCIMTGKTDHLRLVAEAFSTLTLQESFLVFFERRDWGKKTGKNTVQRPWWTFENYVITGFWWVLHHHSNIFWPNPYKQQGEMCEGGVFWCWLFMVILGCTLGLVGDSAINLHSSTGVFEGFVDF